MSQEGHNNPPLCAETAREFSELIAKQLGERPVPVDGLTGEDAVIFADMYHAIRDAADKADQSRKDLRKPHADAVKEVDAGFKPHIEAMRGAAASLRSPLEAYIDQSGPVAGEHVRLSLRGAWKAEIVDLDAALAYYRDHPEVEALLVKLSNAHMAKAKDKADAAIPGVLFRRKATVFASPVGDAPETLVEEDK